MNSVVVQDCAFGKGVFATRNFAVGEVLFRFDGPVISEEEAGKPEIEKYVVQIGPEEYINTNPPGKYTNHSCDPNAGLRDPVTLVAIRPIHRGDHIVFDYSTCMQENSWTMPCACGSRKCRKLIEDFSKLPREIQQHYLRLGVAPAWLFRVSQVG